MKDHRMGLFSGMGMVIANMIGAGVFLSTGFMAQDLNPKQILLAWAIGATLQIAAGIIARLVDHMKSDSLFLFSTDYPHWQFDGDEALPLDLPDEFSRKILSENAPRLLEGS